MSDKERICSLCGLSFPETPEYFYRYLNWTGHYNLRGECKECTKLKQAKRDFKNRFAKAEYCKARYRALKVQC